MNTVSMTFVSSINGYAIHNDWQALNMKLTWQLHNAPIIHAHTAL